MLDLCGARLGASGHVLHSGEVQSLLSDQHWRELSAFLADESPRSVIIAGAQAFVDDSPDDATIKSLHPSELSCAIVGRTIKTISRGFWIHYLDSKTKVRLLSKAQIYHFVKHC